MDYCYYQKRSFNSSSTTSSLTAVLRPDPLGELQQTPSPYSARDSRGEPREQGRHLEGEWSTDSFSQRKIYDFNFSPYLWDSVTAARTIPYANWNPQWFIDMTPLSGNEKNWKRKKKENKERKNEERQIYNEGERKRKKTVTRTVTEYFINKCGKRTLLVANRQYNKWLPINLIRQSVTHIRVHTPRLYLTVSVCCTRRHL